MHCVVTILAAHSREFNVGVAIEVGLSIFLVSGLIYLIAKFLAGWGLVLIPLLSGLLAGKIVTEGGLAAALLLPGVLAAGIAGSLACQLYANIRRMERRLSEHH